MKALYKVGDQKTFQKTVDVQDIAQFESGTVHNVYGTFALGRDAEWSSRLFVLDMKEADEEGIGTFLNIDHQSPALIGQTVTFTATITLLEKNSIHCKVIASVDKRVIANCSTGQKIIKKDKLENLFQQIAHS
jgi:predicted thioesterase